MRVIPLKPNAGWFGTRPAFGRFKKGRDDSLMDWDTHERKISRLTRGTQPAIPLRFVTAIESSRCLLELGPDWDDAGGLPIDEDTWNKAMELLRRTITKIGAAVDTLPVPNISPCADGSIDIFWKNARFTLLVNIQSTDATPDFYAETADGLTLEGTFTSKTRDLSVILRSLLG